jgi:hydrogenase maturation protease
MSWPQPVRVVGLGSPSGDDAAGWEVVKRLREAVPASADVQLQQEDSPVRLLDLLDGRGTLVVIDAGRCGGATGAVHRFTWPDTRLDALRPASTHGIGITQALGLAAALGLLPPRVVLFAVEAGELRPEAGLSPAVAAALPGLVRQVCDELSPG